ncbi:MAG TPA: class I SAM-dependent methyltransferase [Bacteriovoracaceae bacterium]|nr:class I SAM-dependent methyltransferase [Bacteriovoracaceae bacterium]
MKILLLTVVLLTTGVVWCPLGRARDPISGSRFQHLTGIKVTQDSKTQWDQRYSRPTFIFGKSPAEFLAENYQYIPFEGTVLDMGMGEGRNAVFLAQKGYKVTGIDISSVAVKKSYLLAQEFGVKIKGVVASLKDYKISPGSFDAIVCFYFVDRSLIEDMKTWLKPGGILIYEAYTTREKASKKLDPQDEESLLREQELLKLFPGMRVLKYEEPLHEKEFRSSIILKKE